MASNDQTLKYNGQRCAVLLVTILIAVASNTTMSLFVANPAAVPARPVQTEEVISFSFQPFPGEGVQEFCRRIARQVLERSVTPLQFLVFGQCRAHELTLRSLAQTFGPVDWPVTWIEGAAGDGSPIAGIQIHAFTGEVERMAIGSRVVGSVFTDGGARQCVVGGLTPEKIVDSRAEQTGVCLETLQSVLAQAGFELADTVRTWFFLEDILSWYDEFNRVRTQFYSGVKFRTGSLPASTGVGAKNPAGAALALAAWAFRPIGKNAYAEEVASPLQCPAPAYGSSFSRAMEVSTNTGRRLFISGTASIAPGGRTLWVGAVRQQVELTMDVVAAMLRIRGFSWANIERATAYFRRPADARIFGEWLAENSLAALPVVSARCDVCRDDLLFELEAEAKVDREK